jgi:hypothetical protein
MVYHPLIFVKVMAMSMSLLIGSWSIGFAQQEEVTIQTWYSFSLNKNFATNFMFYTNPEYYEMIQGEDKWGQVAWTTGVEYYPNNTFDLYTDIFSTYTQQASGINTMEIRPRLGARWHIVKLERKVPVNLQVLYEFRNQYDIDSSKWSTSHRFRLRPEARISLNRENILQDKNISLRIYGEFFMNVDKAIEERFWNSRQIGMGLYYRHNGRRRYELRYIQQEAKNSLEQERFQVSSHILYFLVTFFM